MTVPSPAMRNRQGSLPFWANRRRLRDNLWGFLFIAPYLVGLLVFQLGPIVGALGLSFANWDLMVAPRFTGGENYQELIDDPVFWRALLNTAYYTFVSVPL